MTEPMYDVLVIGMGPVGAAAATFAGRAGLRTCAVDTSVDVYPLPRATHFDAEIMRLFQRADLVDRLDPLLATYNGGLHLGADGEPIRDFRVPASRSALGWYPHYTFLQPRLDNALRAAADELDTVDSRLGVQVTDLGQDEQQVVATLRNQLGELDVVSARYVIACDGATSSTRKALGIPLLDYGFEEPWIIVDAEVADPSTLPDYSVMFCDPNRPATYIPQPGRNRRWEFMLLAGETATAMESTEAIRQLLKPHVDPETVKIVRSAVYRFHGLIASSWRAGRIFLAGDAAHQTPPFYGQGMCHGIRDVSNLIWKIELALRDSRMVGILDSYQLERHPHVKTIIDAAVENGRYICLLDPEQARERDALLRERMDAGADVTSFRSVIPGLVDGIRSRRSDPRRGELFIQPQVTIGTREALLDEALGAGFALVTTRHPVDSKELRWFRRELKGRVVLVGADVDGTVSGDAVVGDPTGALTAWLTDSQASAVLVRPDRYVFGVTGHDVGTSVLIEELRAQLTGRDC